MSNLNDDMVCIYLKHNCYGKHGGKKSCDIERSLGIGKSDLRKRVNRLRRQGVPIASSQRGYFYAETAGEVYATIRYLKEMAKGLEAAILGLEAAMEHFGERGGNDR